MHLRARLAPVAALLLAAVPSLARAQKKPPMEFTRQGLLILNFNAGQGADWRVGRSAADEVRDRAKKFVDAHEVEVIDAGQIRQRLERDGYPRSMDLDLAVLDILARMTRADEYVTGTVSKAGGTVRIEGGLRLIRSKGTFQPLPAAEGASLSVAADAFARSLAAARPQLAWQRRCVNAVREGKAQQGLDAAKQGIALSPKGAYIQACHVTALVAAGAPAGEVLQAAQTTLAIDSTSREALDGAGRALDVLGRRDAAAEMWLRLAATDTGDAELALRAVGGLTEGGNAKRAEPLLARLVAAHPEDVTLRRVQWQTAFTAKDWPLAARVGDTLVVVDSVSRSDAAFYARLAAAHREVGGTHIVRAISLAAHGVDAFPKDARLYELYADLVRAERDTVVPRGLALFPNSAPLHALEAKDLKTRGNAEGALAALQKAVALDSTIAQGVLAIAQAEFDLGRPDSAFTSLTRALVRGEDTAAVAQFALAKGNVLLRAANQTQVRGDYERALRFFKLADTVRSTPTSKFLIGTAALNVSKAALTEAPKLADRGGSCTMARLGGDALVAARAGLEAGAAISETASKQYLDYAGQLAPFADKQVALYCGEAVTGASGITSAPKDMVQTPRVP